MGLCSRASWCESIFLGRPGPRLRLGGWGMGVEVGAVVERPGKALTSVGTDCLCCLNCGGRVSLSVSRGGWGSLGVGVCAGVGGRLVEERSLVADSRPRIEFKDEEHLPIVGEGARQEGSLWWSRTDLRGELVTVWESRAAIGLLLSTGSAGQHPSQSSASRGKVGKEKGWASHDRGRRRGRGVAQARHITHKG